MDAKDAEVADNAQDAISSVVILEAEATDGTAPAPVEDSKVLLVQSDDDHEDDDAVVRRTTDDIMKGLAKGLDLFSIAYAFMLVVEVIIVILLFLRIKFSGNKVKDYVVPVVFATCRVAAWVLLGTMIVIFSRVASHHFLKAAECTERTNKISRHQEKAMLFLASLFNTMGVLMGLLALMDGSEAVIIYKQVVAVIAVSALVVAASWALGLTYIRHWFLHSDNASTDGRIQLEALLTATSEERSKAPLLVRFWIRKIFGRFWQRPGELPVVSRVPTRNGNSSRPAKKSCCGRKKKTVVADAGEYRRVKFVPSQIHILKMLPEAMWNASGSIMLSVYSSVLVVGTLLVSDLQFGLIFSPLLEIVRNGLVVYLVIYGAYVFEGALYGGTNSDMDRLTQGFMSLEGTFARLTRSFAITSLIQLATVAWATYTAISTKVLTDV